MYIFSSRSTDHDPPVTSKVMPPNFPGEFYWYGGHRRGLRKRPQWVDNMLKGQQSFDSNTEPHIMSTLGSEGETFETGDTDLEDKDDSTDLSDVETPDQWTTMDNVNSQTETTAQPSTASSPLTTHRRNTVHYNLWKHPPPPYKILYSHARD